jgi:uncharacterized Fe-S cluster protein YjdI
MKREAVLKYGNDEVTVLWIPERCIHSGICARGLPQVFRPRERPWIVVDAAAAESIVEQVGRCPSGALAIATRERGVTESRPDVEGEE